MGGWLEGTKGGSGVVHAGNANQRGGVWDEGRCAYWEGLVRDSEALGAQLAWGFHIFSLPVGRHGWVDRKEGQRR